MTKPNKSGPKGKVNKGAASGHEKMTKAAQPKKVPQKKQPVAALADHASLAQQTKVIASKDILFRGASGTFLHVDQKSGAVTERVATTGGFSLKSDVHTVDPSSKLQKSESGLKHLDSSGNTLKDHPFGEVSDKTVKFSNTGWIVDTIWSNASTEPIVLFSATFAVPPPPQNTTEPLIYIFTAIECAQEDDILQPVLKWGPSSAPGEINCWSVYSTFISARLPTQQTNSIRVQPGQTLTASIELKDQTDRVLNYVCEFEGIPETKIEIGTKGDIGVNLKCFIVLEAYNTRFAESDYPDTTKTVFSHINVKTANGFAPVQWKTESRNVLDSESITVITDGSQNGVIEIAYNPTV